MPEPVRPTARAAAAARSAPPPASGGWHEGDPVGRRRFADLGALDLEGGGSLPAVRMAYETWGPAPRDAEGSVLVVHALTGDSHVVGGAGAGHPTPGWWPSLVGPGAPIDTDRFHVVAPNVLGGCQGTTGPSSLAADGAPHGSRFPLVSVRDQVAAEALLADALGIRTWHLVVGGSMGGMRAVEWAVAHPARVDRLLAVATGARATADQVAWWSAEQAAVRGDAAWRGGDYHDAPPGGGPHAGLGQARRIAHLTYRTALELELRFGRERQDEEDPLAGGRFAVESYLDHAAAKLVRRFDAGSYVALSRSMQTHDVGRGRGGVARALGGVTATARVVAIDSDRLFPLELSEELAEHLPGAAALDVVASPYGHDGFLIETGAVGRVARELADAPPRAGPGGGLSDRDGAGDRAPRGVHGLEGACAGPGGD